LTGSVLNRIDFLFVLSLDSNGDGPVAAGRLARAVDRRMTVVGQANISSRTILAGLAGIDGPYASVYRTLVPCRAAGVPGQSSGEQHRWPR
jgi:hypothetical protein